MLKQVIDVFEILDRPDASGKLVKELFEEYNIENFKIETVTGDKGSTDFVKILIPGAEGKTKGGEYPTLGIIGRLGGLGARPEMMGFVSDGDGALAALAAGLKLAKMNSYGDVLKGDVIISTHICPDAPTREHKPVPFMDSPVGIDVMNDLEVDKDMDAIISIDTTKGNNIITNKGISMSPTVKEGYILRVSEDLLDIMMRVTGKIPNVFALAQQDITPYGNDLYHLNSILQPAVATNAPVVGLALATEVAVAGCATGATHLVDIELASRFSVEVAKDFTNKICEFYDKEEYKKILELYGEMNKFQKK
ncbi:MAG: DUF1177 domain-containing protein [Tissierellales bacterium]|jgi:hypothetical protein|nr:DUF1177 domain-containing protein [Tissierellales bacterium]